MGRRLPLRYMIAVGPKEPCPSQTLPCPRAIHTTTPRAIPGAKVTTALEPDPEPQQPGTPSFAPGSRLIFTDFYRILGLSWETSPQTVSTPEASRHSGSGRIEFSSKSTTFLM